MVPTPIRLSASPKAGAIRAPQSGEHSDEILTDIGYDGAAIAALRAMPRLTGKQNALF